MPLIYIDSPEGTFSDAGRDALAEELTVLALETEGLPMTPFDKSTTWIYFRELPPTHAYHGGRAGGAKIIGIEINAFVGGHDESAKRSLYEVFTEAIRKHAGIPEGARVPVYIILRQIEPIDWGVFGGTTSIDELRVAHPDVEPI